MSIMRRSLLAGTLLCSSVGWSLEFAPRSSSEILTLRSSFERAINNNSQLLLARKELDVARTHLSQARSLFYPHVNLNVDYIRYRHETLGLIPSEMGDIVLETPKVTEGVTGNPAQNLYLGRLGFIQTLYAGGKLDATYRLSQANVKRAESGYETLKRDIEFETAGGFYRLLEIQQQEKILKDAIFDLEKLSQQAGNVHSQLSIARAQSALRQKQGDLRQHEQRVKFDYLRSMGVELFTDIQVDGELTLQPHERDLQTDLIWAKNNRVELKETVILEEVDKLAVDLSLAERYPVFLLGGGMEVRNNDFPLNDTNWNAGLSMNIPLFDGFSSLARIRESRYRADQGRLRRVQLEDQIELEVRSSHADYLHWSEEVSAREKELATLERSRRPIFDRAGGGSLSDRVDYIRWVVDAKTSLVEAQYELCMANARLAKALGKSFLDE